MPTPRAHNAIGLAFALAAGALSLAGAACSSHDGSGTGGAAATGGAIGTGGVMSSTGGASATGGTSSTGGAKTGGAIGTGGVATGGANVGGAGGQFATGGQSTAGGKGGSPGGATGGSSGGGSSGAGSILVANFDDEMTGKTPTGWDTFIAYTLNGQNPNGKNMVVVDETRAHSGKKSVHVHGGQSPAQMGYTLPTGTKRLYMRAFVYLTRQIGMHDQNASNHDGLFVLRKAAKSADDEVRFGEIKGAIGTNEVPTDDISPAMKDWGKGMVIAANDWRCIEVAWLGDASPHQLIATVDGTVVHSVTATDQWEHKNATATFLNGKFGQAVLGWQSFSNVETDLWIDDVVLSGSPVGCK